MNRLVAMLLRLPGPPDGGFRIAPRPAPDPDARAGAWLVAIATSLAAAIYLVGDLFDAAALTPEFTRTILTQVGHGSVSVAFREALGIQSPLGPAGEFAISAYAMLPIYGAASLFDNPASPAAVVVMRTLVAVLNLLGAPMLYAAARRSGLRDCPSALAAVMYLVSPFFADKIGWDSIGFMGTPLIAAYWALQAGRPGWATACWFVAAGGHPFTLWAITLWALEEWRQSERAGRPVTALRLAAAWFPVQAALNLANVFVVPLISPASLAGYMKDHVASGRFQPGILPWHALSVAGFLAGFAFLPLARARWLILAGADLLYYLGTGLNHGLIPLTTGLMALATVEALRDAQDGEVPARTGPFRRIALRLAGPGARRGVQRAVLVGALLLLPAANVLFPEGNPYRRLVRGTEWDDSWISGVETVAGAIPSDVDLCLVQPWAFGAIDGRCPEVLPWAWPETGERVEAGTARVAHVVVPAMFDRRRFARRTLLPRRDHEVRVELCDGLAAGRLAVAAASGGACAIVSSRAVAASGLDACPGLCPAPTIEGAGEFSEREPKAPVPGQGRQASPDERLPGDRP